jgi:hypothetical protein
MSSSFLFWSFFRGLGFFQGFCMRATRGAFGSVNFWFHTLYRGYGYFDILAVYRFLQLSGVFCRTIVQRSTARWLFVADNYQARVLSGGIGQFVLSRNFAYFGNYSSNKNYTKKIDTEDMQANLLLTLDTPRQPLLETFNYLDLGIMVAPTFWYYKNGHFFRQLRTAGIIAFGDEKLKFWDPIDFFLPGVSDVASKSAHVQAFFYFRYFCRLFYIFSQKNFAFKEFFFSLKHSLISWRKCSRRMFTVFRKTRQRLKLKRALRFVRKSFSFSKQLHWRTVKANTKKRYNG